jgi:sulfur carrier protein ThiS
MKIDIIYAGGSSKTGEPNETKEINTLEDLLKIIDIENEDIIISKELNYRGERVITIYNDYIE